MIARLRRAEPPTLFFAAAVLTSGVLLFHWLSRLTFWRDEWAFLLDRREWSVDAFLDPFVEQLLAIPVAIYKVGIEAFGMDSAVPFQIPSVLMFLLAMVLLFVYVRRRAGGWLALAAVLPILFFGPAWDDLLFPFQVSFFGSTACGLGALLALDRRDHSGDVAATVLLATSLFFSHVGIPFVAAIALEVALDRDRFRRAYIVAIPTALWLLWYLGWGRAAENFVSFHNFSTLTGYVPDGFASSLSYYLGLGTPRDETTISALDWGRPLLVIALGVAAWRIYRLGPRNVAPRLWTVIAIPTVFWSLTGLNATAFGQATSPRYQLLGAVGLVLIAAELLRGVRITRPAIVVTLVVTLAAALANLSLLEKAANGLAGIAERQRAGLAALQLMRGEVEPDFVLSKKNSDVNYLRIISAEKWFSGIDAYGSPAYTPAELAGSSETARVAADRVFAAGLGVGLAPVSEAQAGQCTPVPLGAEPAVIRPAPGGAVLRVDRGETRVRLRRYAAESFPVEVGSLNGGQGGAIEIPADGSSEPWELELSGRGSVSVCELTAT